jgi:hypothetical protein
MKQSTFNLLLLIAGVIGFVDTVFACSLFSIPGGTNGLGNL